MLYVKISPGRGSGFTNQIMTFVYSIINAIKSNHRVVVVDSFFIDNFKSDSTPISNIINIEELNVFLLQKYNVVVIDKYNSKWKLIKVQYGTDSNKIDITPEIIDSSLFCERLFISKYTDFNKIKGDPLYGEKKQIYLKYEIAALNESNVVKTINNSTHETSPMNEYSKYTFEEIYNESLSDNIIIDIENSEYQHQFMDLYNIYGVLNVSDIYEEILKRITYSPEFHNIASNIITMIDFKQKTNVIHLRVEPDAIEYWSKINQMAPNVFQKHIEEKYIELIKKYMNKTDLIIVLSNSVINGVVDFLLTNHYNIFITQKYFEHREKNALVDLLISKRCNNVFIGCFNSEYKIGSSFSYYISKIVDKCAMKVGINIDFITHPEQVFY